MSNCHLNWWKEAVKKENVTRDVWNKSFSSTGEHPYHSYSKPAENVQYVTASGYKQHGTAHPSAYANNPYVANNPYQTRQYSRQGMKQPSGSTWLPQPRSNYQQTGWIPALESTQGNRYEMPAAGVATHRPRAPQANAWAAHTLPAAGSAGHSPKNGHFVNGHCYPTGSHREMMTRHNQRFSQGYQPIEERGFRYTQ